MSLTSNSDLYISVTDECINRLYSHIQKQRPSLFNYASVAFNNDGVCKPINSDIAVTTNGNPIVSKVPAISLPELFNNTTLDYCMQAHTFKVDFFPYNVITTSGIENIPDNLLIVQFELCLGLKCPQTSDIPCPCLQCFAIFSFERTETQIIVPKLYDMNMEGIGSNEINLFIKCFSKHAFSLITTKLSEPISELIKNINLAQLSNGTIGISSLSLKSKIEENQFKIYTNFELKINPLEGGH